MADDDRRRILERRQRFLTATMCGATAGALLSACDQTGAACHSARRNLPRSVVQALGCAPPTVCLTVAIVDAGAGAPLVAPPEAGAKVDDDDGGTP